MFSLSSIVCSVLISSVCLAILGDEEETLESIIDEYFKEEDN